MLLIYFCDSLAFPPISREVEFGRRVEALSSSFPGDRPRTPLSCLAQQSLGFRLNLPAQFMASGEVRFGFRQTVLHQAREAAIHVSIGQTRIELQRLIVIRNRPLVILLSKPDYAAMIPGFRQSRIERERVVKIVQSALEFSFHQPRSAAIAVEVRSL